MKIETKFNFKDVVYRIEETNKSRFIECEYCSGTGKLKANNDDLLRCPGCYGTRGKTVYDNKKYVVGKPMTIGKICIEHTCANEIDYGDDFTGNIRTRDGGGKTNFGEQEEKYEEGYMCYETGIGSGTRHRGGLLYSTKEKAQVECDKKNKNVCIGT